MATVCRSCRYTPVPPCRQPRNSRADDRSAALATARAATPGPATSAPVPSITTHLPQPRPDHPRSTRPRLPRNREGRSKFLSEELLSECCLSEFQGRHGSSPRAILVESRLHGNDIPCAKYWTPTANFSSLSYKAGSPAARAMLPAHVCTAGDAAIGINFVITMPLTVVTGTA